MITTFKIKRFIWQWALRRMRNVVWRADEWIYEQERQFRVPARMVRPSDEFNPVSSRKRERVHKTAQRPAHARLRYQHGEWIQTNS